MKRLKEQLTRLLICFAAVALILASAAFMRGKRRDQRIVVGGKNCSEQHILAELFAQIFERNLPIKVSRCFNLEGTTITFNALRSKTIDVYFEYTGTAQLDILKEIELKEPLYPHVKEELEKRFGLFFLDPLGFSNQYALIARKSGPLRKISELHAHPNQRLALDPEFAARLEYKLLKKAYPLPPNFQLMDQVLLYFSLGSGGVDLISGFSTDGRLFGEDFIALEDDLHIFPNYEVAPLVTKKCLTKHPELLPLFEKMKGAISNEMIGYLNYQVEILHEPVPKVVTEFLDSGKIPL